MKLTSSLIPEGRLPSLSWATAVLTALSRSSDTSLETRDRMSVTQFNRSWRLGVTSVGITLKRGTSISMDSCGEIQRTFQGGAWHTLFVCSSWVMRPLMASSLPTHLLYLQQRYIQDTLRHQIHQISTFSLSLIWYFKILAALITHTFCCPISDSKRKHFFITLVLQHLFEVEHFLLLSGYSGSGLSPQFVCHTCTTQPEVLRSGAFTTATKTSAGFRWGMVQDIMY